MSCLYQGITIGMAIVTVWIIFIEPIFSKIVNRFFEWIDGE